MINKERYSLSFNRAFYEVIRQCGNLHMEEGAWLGEDMMKAYPHLV